MACDENNVIKGKSLVLAIRNETDTAWELAGGVVDLDYTLDSPVEDITSSSTTGNYQESDPTGFKQCTINFSGKADKRVGTVDPATGLTIVSAGRILEIMDKEVTSGGFKIFNNDTGGTLEGCFNVTNYNKSRSATSLVNYSATLQSKSEVTIVGDV
jgi:predicted secreted protein